MKILDCMMKLAVITDTFYPYKGGSSKRYYEVMRRLVKLGVDVTVYTVRLKQEWKIEETIDNIHVKRTKQVLDKFITKDGLRSISQTLIYTSWIAQELLEDDYDIIELNQCPLLPPIIAHPIRMIKHKSLSITFHEVWHNYWHNYTKNIFISSLGIFLENLTTRIPDKLVAVSWRTALRLSKCFNVDLGRIKLIPNGVNPEIFNENKDRDAREMRIIYVGKFFPHKRIDLLIDAYQIIKLRYPKLRLCLIGDGPLRAYYMKYVKNKGINNIEFLGEVKDELLYQLLASSMIYVLPSVREGQSITTLEAMAAGTPQIVVKAPTTAAQDIVSKARSGLIVNPSPIEIAEAIKTLLSNETLWREFSVNGAKFARRYSWDRIAKMYLEHYKSLVR